MPYHQLEIPKQDMLGVYVNNLSDRGYTPDPAQMRAAQRLQHLYSELLTFKATRSSKFKRFLLRPRPPRGIYFWGGVGRGKSFLMDCFFDTLPYRRKRRIHFHAFMQEMHKELEGFKGSPDPVLKVAEKIARQTRLLCFDEFHVSDIADAMILGRLLTGLESQGVVLVMTSNYPPDNLYPNGLQRENFLPTIELIKRNMDILEVDAGIDYRLRTLEQVELYHYPSDSIAEEKMKDYFYLVAGKKTVGDGFIEVLGRKISTLGQADEVVWFTFLSLCDGPRSQNDYLEIARRYSTVMLSNIPMMTQRQASEARRFTWLVDIFYEYKVKLIVTADCPPEKLYTEGTLANEFTRTVSRLIEMGSEEYLKTPYLGESR